MTAMKLPRRDFIRRTAAGVGGLLVAQPSGAAPGATFDPYALVPLGKTGLQVSRVALGTGTRGGNRESNHTRMGKAKFEALVRGAFERGMRVFDCADTYGTHPFIAPVLKTLPRDRYHVVSKLWWAEDGGIPERERPDARVVVARFLKELGTDHIDLLLLHCVTSGTWPQDLRRQMDQLSECKAKGLVRALGVSCHSVAALDAAASESWVESVHTRINPFTMSMDGPPEAVVPVLQRIHARGKGVIGMKIMGEGRLRTDDARRDQSVKFALTLGCVDVLNVGCETVEEIDDLAARVRKVAA
jgi:aryl-alcohol dehydrogenase-like predicted oxidoreductase